MNEIDFHQDVEIECRVRGIDLGNPDHASRAVEVLAIFRAESEHRASRERTWGKIRAVDAALGWIAAHPSPTIADCLHLFRDPQARLGFELAAAHRKEP